MTASFDVMQSIDATVRACTSDEISIDTARKTIRPLLLTLAEIPPDTSLSFADIFETIATQPESISNPDLATISVLLVSTPALLPTSFRQNASRHVLHIIDHGNPRLFTGHDIDRTAQTYQQYADLSRIHSTACEHLAPLVQPFSALHDLVGRRQTLMRSLNHGPTKTYLNPLGFQAVTTSLASILGLAEKTLASQDHLLQTNLHNLTETLEDALDAFRSIDTFIVQLYFLPLLNRLDTAIKLFRESMADKFACIILPPPSNFEIEKRYPLHVPGATIELLVPLTNTGPGSAQNVRAYCLADDCNIQSDDTLLGAIEPGAFVLSIVAQVTKPVESLNFDVVLDWEMVGVQGVQSIAFSLLISCQRTDLDWTVLARQQPYSLEVAYDEDFFGRHDTLAKILHRLGPGSMQSCYITGQKRVGKSSLAHAVAARVRCGTVTDEYFVLYCNYPGLIGPSVCM